MRRFCSAYRLAWSVLIRRTCVDLWIRVKFNTIQCRLPLQVIVDYKPVNERTCSRADGKCRFSCLMSWWTRKNHAQYWMKVGDYFKCFMALWSNWTSLYCLVIGSCLPWIVNSVSGAEMFSSQYIEFHCAMSFVVSGFGEIAAFWRLLHINLYVVSTANFGWLCSISYLNLSINTCPGSKSCDLWNRPAVRLLFVLLDKPQVWNVWLRLLEPARLEYDQYRGATLVGVC